VEIEASNLKEICEMLDTSSASMTTIRDAAKDGNFVKELDSTDRRKKFYIITDLGKEMLASARQ
jgi:DNA-binding MarR family transcriptional regulator